MDPKEKISIPQLKPETQKYIAEHQLNTERVIHWKNVADMEIAKDEPLIFYNNYIGRVEHFGLLLAEMEKEGIITDDQISFGNKG